MFYVCGYDTILLWDVPTEEPVMTDTILAKVLKIQREKSAVRVAHVSEAMKRHLLTQLDMELAALEAELRVGNGHTANVVKK